MKLLSKLIDEPYIDKDEFDDLVRFAKEKRILAYGSEKRTTGVGWVNILFKIFLEENFFMPYEVKDSSPALI